MSAYSCASFPQVRTRIEEVAGVRVVAPPRATPVTL
jgi:hypothetical protein